MFRTLSGDSSHPMKKSTTLVARITATPNTGNHETLPNISKVLFNDLTCTSSWVAVSASNS